ncbi:tryptophan synthase subunit beta [Dialister sp.]|uniref:tryptophan synthase subunit beta n=1 Tax=Dialister sp. TaxID=1955814 RepID=UPI002E7FC979|nr:tryptophan synthase subunit beta [Dialister sp.]MEE3453269.1 tryptophan synthase subunit beta [Dialister sp.]
MKTRFGEYGGQYVPEVLMNEVNRVGEAFEACKKDREFQDELHRLFVEYTGRPSMLYEAENMEKDLGGPRIFLKREDLNHTGAHKINNCIGQALLAKKMGKTRIIAETGAGQHGVAAATIAALFGMECEVFMGEIDTQRQALNVYRMKLLGAKVNVVKTGSRVLKDAVNAAMQEWSRRCDDTHYVIGSTTGPAPFPEMVRYFQSCIGREARAQVLERTGSLPTRVYACVGGGSNAAGTFYPFVQDAGVQLIGCEAGGKGIDTPYHAATVNRGRLGVFHGMKSIFCQDDDGNITEVYSISAGLDYPGVSPEHAYLNDIGRARYIAITDEEAVQAFEYLAKTEGIICAIESAHAVAGVLKEAKNMTKDDVVVITLSGRGDKDVAAIARYRGENLTD